MSHRDVDVDCHRHPTPPADGRRAAAPQPAARYVPALSMMVTASASRSPRPSWVTAAGWCRAELDLEVPDSRSREGLVPFPHRASRGKSRSFRRPARRLPRPPRFARPPGSCSHLEPDMLPDPDVRRIPPARRRVGRSPVNPVRRGRGLLSRGRGRSHLSRVYMPKRPEVPTMNHPRPTAGPSTFRKQTGRQL